MTIAATPTTTPSANAPTDAHRSTARSSAFQRDKEAIGAAVTLCVWAGDGFAFSVRP